MIQQDGDIRRAGPALGRGLWVLLAVGAAGTAPRPLGTPADGRLPGPTATLVEAPAGGSVTPAAPRLAGLPFRYLPWSRLTEPSRDGWPYIEYPPVPAGRRLAGLLRTFTFQRNSSAVDAEARGTLVSAVDAWRQRPGTFLLVVGHADGFAERGRARGLALARAKAAEAVLAAHGVPRSRMKALSLGAEYSAGSEEQFVILSPDRKVEIWAFR